MAVELGRHQRVVDLGVADLVPALARHVDVEVPRHLGVLVRVARHQLGGAQLGVHQPVEEVLLLLRVGGDVVLVAVDVELVGEVRVALLGDLDVAVARRLVERRHDGELAHLAQADGERAEVVERRRGRRRGQLGDVALLAVQQLRELAQATARRASGRAASRWMRTAAISAGLSSP